MNYPKISTLFLREDAEKGRKSFVIEKEYAYPEFKLIKEWLVTEKIDGTNIKITISKDKIELGGKSDKAELPEFLEKKLHQIFDEHKGIKELQKDLDEETKIVLFGEGYGFMKDKTIQKAGKFYGELNFILIDVVILKDRIYWQNWDKVKEFAEKLNLKTIAVVKEKATTEEAINLIKKGFQSILAKENDKEMMAEGIVARTEPYVYRKMGERVAFKLKYKDFKRD